MSGYVFTPDGAAALLAIDLDPLPFSGIRYAAALDDGSGIVALDGDYSASPSFGTFRMAIEPHPDYPPSWPWKAPKRHVSNGKERFALMSLARFENTRRDPIAASHITGAVMLDDGSMFVETDGWVLVADWTAAAVEVRDRRLVTA